MVQDDEPSITDSDKLIVTFFTTKFGGSGIGLVPARQIFWVQGDSVRIRNRTGVCGAVTRV